MSKETFHNICRICFGDRKLFNWNEEIFEFCGISYKDCYYNYIQVEESASDFYANKLCGMCGEELKNAHFLFERALESYYIIQNCTNSKTLFNDYSDVEIKNMPAERMLEPEESSDTNGSRDIENSNYNSSEMVHEIITKEENEIIDYQEILVDVVEQTDPDQIKDIEVFEPHKEALIQKEPALVCENELKTCDEKIPLQSDNVEEERLLDVEVLENTKEITCQQTSENSREPNTSEEPKSTTQKRLKIRKKYILICQYCSLEVDGSNQLKKHEATHNENRERNHVCNKCSIKFYTQPALKEHMKIHIENRKKDQQCEFCEKAFYNKGALNVHRRIHLGLMLQCKICLKEFFRQVDLDRHLLQHSATAPGKNIVKKKYAVQCQYCSKTVLTAKLKRHMAMHSNQPQVKCKICDKAFFGRTECANHLRRFHSKSRNEYDEFIHYLVENNKRRMSLLKLKQETHVQVITK